VHRAWIVDGGRLAGVLSLTDILSRFSTVDFSYLSYYQRWGIHILSLFLGALNMRSQSGAGSSIGTDFDLDAYRCHKRKIPITRPMSAESMQAVVVVTYT